MITTLKIRSIDKIVIAFLLTIWIGVWLGYYFFIPGFTYIHTANVLQALIHWDAGWYLDIAQHGYTYNGNDLMQQNIAFFPLYPIIMKFFGQFFGLRNGIATVLPALFIGITSIYAFHALASTILKENASLFATAAYALYPGATFFCVSLPYFNHESTGHPCISVTKQEKVLHGRDSHRYQHCCGRAISIFECNNDISLYQRIHGAD